MKKSFLNCQINIQPLQFLYNIHPNNPSNFSFQNLHTSTYYLMELLSAHNYWFSRLLFERGLALFYLIGFLVAWNQFVPLLGENGLLPVKSSLSKRQFWQKPSLFHLHYTDRFFRWITGFGILLSLAMLFGVIGQAPIWLYILSWLILYFLYLSIFNVGRTFYSFGWESMLVEAGFFAAFLGPAWVAPSWIPIITLRWMLFRVEVGAGLIKLRGDSCWRDLTCLYYHHETQPLPNPLSWYAHHAPKFLHRWGVLFSHFVQIIVPFFLFTPQPVATAAALFIIVHQLLLIVSGNYSWLNWLTILLGVSAISDGWFQMLIAMTPPELPMRALWFECILFALAIVTILLSIKPAINLFSKNQYMNASFNQWHIINTYGAFGSVTKNRYEIVIEGTDDETVTPDTQWQEYEFKAKPGNVKRTPPQIAPYHLRLDWLMWFLPLSVPVRSNGIVVPGYQIWFVSFIKKLLEGDQETLSLLRHNPFPDVPPRIIRARFYHYRFTSPAEKKESGCVWSRKLVDEYLPPVSLEEVDRILHSP